MWLFSLKYRYKETNLVFPKNEQMPSLMFGVVFEALGSGGNI